MDKNKSLSPSLAISDLQLELNQLRTQLQIAEEKVIHLELALMQSRDFAIGSAAQAGEALANLNKLHHIEDMLDDANIHIENHLKHIEKLETTLGEVARANEVHRAKSRQLDLVYESASWKIGRFLMLPVRIIKRIVR
jgi:hypothetical protein